MSSSPLWQRLCGCVNLSEYEAKVYASLIEEGPATARRLSILCSVPRTKIYKTLKKLIEQGLVTEAPTEPIKFAPLPPNDTFKSFLNSYEEKIRNFSNLISVLEDDYKKAVDSAKMKRGEVWILLGRTEILGKIHEIMSRAEKTVEIVTTENGLILFYRMYNVFLDKLGKNGIEIRIAAPLSPKNQRIIQELSYVSKIKHLEAPCSVLLVKADHNEFLLASLIPNDYKLTSDKDIGMFCRSSYLCSLITYLFPMLRTSRLD